MRRSGVTTGIAIRRRFHSARARSRSGRRGPVGPSAAPTRPGISPPASSTTRKAIASNAPTTATVHVSAPAEPAADRGCRIFLISRFSVPSREYLGADHLQRASGGSTAPLPRPENRMTSSEHPARAFENFQFVAFDIDFSKRHVGPDDGVGRCKWGLGYFVRSHCGRDVLLYGSGT